MCNASPQHLKRMNNLLSLGNIFEHLKQCSSGSIGMGVFVSGSFETGVFVLSGSIGRACGTDVFVSPGIEGAEIVLI